jgi:hypothetical protein
MIAFLLLPLLGATAGDASSFAKSLALLGDQDGDRCSEIAVGSPSDGDGHRGKLFVFSGKSGDLLRELTGDAPDGAFGTDVAGVGDQDGDKIPDFAVGAPFVRGDKGQGKVVVFSGKDGHALRTLAAEAGESYFGTDLVAAGDLNGDKKEDLLVHMRVGAGKEEHERFAAYTLATGKRLFAVDGPPGILSHDLGRPLAHIPDVDGDGVPDLAFEWAIEVHLCSGKDGKVLKTIASPIPPQDMSRFGFSICGLEGKPPIVAVGDIQQDGHGSVRLFSIDSLPAAGAAEKAAASAAEKEGGGAVLTGDEGFSGVGRSLAVAGDVDGDGKPDLAVGWSDGRVGGVMLLSSKDLSAARAIED